MAAANEAQGGRQAEARQPLGRQVLLERWTEIILAVIMGVVALATAWSGYQSARWGGVQLTQYSQAGALRSESIRATTTAGQLVQIDIGIFTNWINAWAQENGDLADFYEVRFRGEFVPAFEAWLATDPLNNPNAPNSPFAMPEYRVSLAEQADQLVQEAEATFDEGGVANQQSDDYILNAVILASVLFLAGIASRFAWLPVRIAVILAALGLLTLGLYNLATYPVA